MLLIAAVECGIGQFHLRLEVVVEVLIVADRIVFLRCVHHLLVEKLCHLVTSISS